MVALSGLDHAATCVTCGGPRLQAGSGNLTDDGFLGRVVGGEHSTVELDDRLGPSGCVVGPRALAAVIVRHGGRQLVQRQRVRRIEEGGRPIGRHGAAGEHAARGELVLRPLDLDSDEVAELGVWAVADRPLEPVGQGDRDTGPVGGGLRGRDRAGRVDHGGGDLAILLADLVHRGVTWPGRVADAHGDRATRPVRPGRPEAEADREDVGALDLRALPVGGDGEDQPAELIVGVGGRATGRVGLADQQPVVVAEAAHPAGRVDDLGDHAIGDGQFGSTAVRVDDGGGGVVDSPFDRGDVAPPIGPRGQPAVCVVAEGRQYRSGPGAQRGQVTAVGGEGPDLVARLVRDAVDDRFTVDGAAEQRVVARQGGQILTAATEDDDLAVAVHRRRAEQRLPGDQHGRAIRADVQTGGRRDLARRSTSAGDPDASIQAGDVVRRKAGLERCQVQRIAHEPGLAGAERDAVRSTDVGELVVAVLGGHAVDTDLDVPAVEPLHGRPWQSDPDDVPVAADVDGGRFVQRMSPRKHSSSPGSCSSSRSASAKPPTHSALGWAIGPTSGYRSRVPAPA